MVFDLQALVATIAGIWIVSISAAVISLMIAKSKKDIDGQTINDLTKYVAENMKEIKESFGEMEGRVTEKMKEADQRVTTALHNMNIRQDNFNKSEIQELKEALKK